MRQCAASQIQIAFPLKLATAFLKTTSLSYPLKPTFSLNDILAQKRKIHAFRLHIPAFRLYCNYHASGATVFAAFNVKAPM